MTEDEVGIASLIEEEKEVIRILHRRRKYVNIAIQFLNTSINDKT